MSGSFLEEPPMSAEVQALYDSDLADDDFVWNVSRLWAHQPATVDHLFALMSEAFRPSGLTFRQRGILVTAAASALGISVNCWSFSVARNSFTASKRFSRSWVRVASR